MDIHPPERPAHSIREFLLQIFTITCGIVIALGLEGLVADRRDARLAAETRADFSAELSENLGKVELLRGFTPADEKWINAVLAWGTARLKHTDAKPPSDLQGRRFAVLNNAAWETAIATQATRLLSFAEARALARAYNSQAALNAMSAQAREQWLTVSGYEDVENLTDAELRDALRALHVSLSFTLSLDALESRVISDYKSAQVEIGKAR